MSKTNYIYILATFLLTVNCTDSPKEQNKNASTETELTTEIPDTVISKPEEIVVEEIPEESSPKTAVTTKYKSDLGNKDTPTDQYPGGSTNVTNSYLILQSTTSYSAAAFTAKNASEQLGAKLDLRGYVFDFKQGLRDTAVCGCGQIHEYVPRGRFDDGNYVSIEHTNSFTEFTDGYYIVVAGSGKRSTLKPILAKVKPFYGDAYIKDAEVYIGCLH